jgi:hypothetical protein
MDISKAVNLDGRPRPWAGVAGTIVGALLCVALPPVGLFVSGAILVMNVRGHRRWLLVIINSLLVLYTIAWIVFIAFGEVQFPGD